MAYQLTSNEIAQIEAARNLCPLGNVSPTSTGNWMPFYTMLSSIIGQRIADGSVIGNDLQDLKNAQLWLDVAIGANGGTGIHSAFIRTYTNRQGELRRGSAFSDTEMQYASNGVALNLYNNLGGISLWQVPSISTIADSDASSIGINLFGANSSQPLLPGDTAIDANAAWSGALGFNLLGGSPPYESWRLISAGNNSTPDTLDDFKNLLFAVDAYDQALKMGYTTGALEFLQYLFHLKFPLLVPPVDLSDIAAQLKINLASGNWGGWINDVAAFTPAIAPAIKLLTDVGVNNFLDMLKGASLGKPMYGTTTDTNFVTNAHDFFALTPSELQNLHVEMMPTNAVDISSLAQTDVNARAALVAISSISVQVSTTVASALDLYDPITGQGNFTTAYLDDRAHMLSHLMERDAAHSIAIPASSTHAYDKEYFFDATSNIHLYTPSALPFPGNTEPAPDVRRVMFGADNAADPLTGGLLDDHLYGMGGNDTLIGSAGNDYLEGGLEIDTYISNTGDGTDTILDTDGLGSIVHNGLTLSGGQNTAPNKWEDTTGSTYTLIDTGAGLQDLFIEAGGESLLIKGFSDGELGIHLTGEVAPIPFTQSGNGITIFGDRMPYQMPWDYWLWLMNPTWPYLFDSNGNMVRTNVPQPFYADKIFDTAGDDTFYAGDGFNVIFAYNGGNNLIQTGANDDYIVGGIGRDKINSGGMTDTIDAGAGDDIVYGEAGGDVIEGGIGDDFLSGGAGADAINGGEGNDQIYGGNSITWEHAITDSGVAVSGQGELLTGGAGDDVVIGDATNDALLGGVGDDVIAGREGNDILIGDSDLIFVVPPLSEFDAIIGAARWPMGPYLNFHSPFTTAPMLNILFEKIDHGVGSADRFEVKLSSLNNPEAPRDNWITTAITGGNDQLYGGSGDDWLLGEFGDDVLNGGTGSDVLVGGEGSDVLIGGAGDDVMVGGVGNDTYIINAGDGVDYIYDSISNGDTNTIIFGAGVNPANINLFLGSLGLDLGNGTVVHIGGVDYNDIANTSSIQNFQFYNGTVLTAQQLLTRGFDLDGTDGNDIISGTNMTDRIVAGGGDDALSGGAGDDVLTGGSGNDMLIGGTGDDTYWFNLGDGQDTIQEYDYTPGNIDTIRFGPGITTSDITFTRNGMDLVLGIAGTTDQITIPKWGWSDAWRVERFVFMDGTIWDAAQILAHIPVADTITGTSGNDSISLWAGESGTVQGLEGDDSLFGLNGNDTLIGGTGNDVLVGGLGDDTYVFNLGDGQDTIIDYGVTVDTIRFGTGIFASDITFARSGMNLVLGIVGTADQITIQSWGSGYGYPIKRVEFSDGTVWDQAQINASIPSPGVITGTSGNDTLAAWAGESVTLQGLEGDDNLFGASGNNTLIGGIGNDLLSGGSGEDTYVFNLGDGQDLLVEEAGNLDTLKFGVGIAASNITGALNGTDLVLSIAGTTDQITIQNWGYGAPWGIERIEFFDGTAWDAAQIATLVTGGTHIIDGTEAADYLYGTEGNDVINGLGGDDVLIGGAGDDILNGGTGNDFLDGGLGDDVLDGGAGNDLLGRGEGNNTYLFGIGSGQDTIVNNLMAFPTANVGAGGMGNMVKIGTGIVISDVTAMRGQFNQNDLVLSLNGGADTLTIQDYFLLPPIVISFADGTTIDPNSFNKLPIVMNGTEGADYLTTPFMSYYDPQTGMFIPNDAILNGNGGDDSLNGAEGNDILNGGDGNDYLFGGNGNDVLDGGTGSDVIMGSNGFDTYKFGIGSGQDTIASNNVFTVMTYPMPEPVPTPMTTGIVQMGTGITATDIIAMRGQFNPNDLVLSIQNSNGISDSLTIQNYFNNSSISISFSDGTLLNVNNFNKLPIVMNGTEGADYLTAPFMSYYDPQTGMFIPNDAILNGNDGDDSLNGAEGNDILNGGDGNDYLFGGNGNDVLDGGTGSDVIMGSNGFDTYKFGIGSGHDTIASNNLNTVMTYPAPMTTGIVQMGTGITATDIIAMRGQFNPNDLVLSIQNSNGISDSLTIQNYFNNSSISISFSFSDGTLLNVNSFNALPIVMNGSDAADFMFAPYMSYFDPQSGMYLPNDAVINGNAGDDYLVGADGNDIINGGDGSDSLMGGMGNDVLDGGAGNDLLIGGDGFNTYQFGIGSGQDTIWYDTMRMGDMVMMGTGVAVANVTAARGVSNPDDLVLSINGTTDSLTIQNYFTYPVSGVRFADGTMLDKAALELMANQPPIANPDSFTVFEDGGVANVAAFELLSNDTDPNINPIAYTGDFISIVSVGASAIGASVALVNGQVQYDIGGSFQSPSQGQTVTDSFSYSISDSMGLTSSSVVTVTITGVNDAAVTANDSANVQEDLSQIAMGNVLANDSDIDQGTILTVANAGTLNGTYGNLVLNANGSYTYALNNSSQAVQSLAAGQVVTETFTYLASDGIASTPATLTVTLTGSNDESVTIADAESVQEDGVITTTGNVLANDTDVDQGAVLTVANAGTYTSAYGQLILNANGSYSYLLNNSSQAVQSLAAGQVVTDTFAYQASDGLSTTPSTLTISITGSNDAPVVATALTAQSVTEGQQFSYALPATSFTDIDSSSLAYTATLADGTSLPGWLSFNAATQTFSGTPGAGTLANLSIMVTATDTGGLAASSSFTLAVNAPVLNGTTVANTLTGTIYDDIINGLAGNDTLTGGAGSDTLDGGTGADTMKGGTGNDTYLVDSTGDVVTEISNEGTDTVQSSITYTLGSNLENLALTGTAAISGTGNTLSNVMLGNAAANTMSGGSGNDLLNGNTGNDILKGGGGNDVLEGDIGNDTLSDTGGKNLFNGGAGIDKLTGNSGNELFIGGTGNDTITTGTGADIIAFNKGDGQDIVVASTGTDNTISLGGGIQYANLAMSKSGNNLIFSTGNGDQITLQNWYASTSNHSVANLQVVLDGSTYNPASADTLLNQQVQSFNFATLAANFDTALAATPTLTAWSLTDALLTAHLAGSDTTALGGDLAYQYNLNNSLAGIGLASAQTVMNDANFGTTAQTLKPLNELQVGVVKLG